MKNRDEQLCNYFQTIRDFSGDEFWKLCKCVTRHMKSDCATILFSYFMNKLYMMQQSPDGWNTLVKNNAWVKCPAKEIEDNLEMGEVRRRGCLKRLEEENIIRFKYKYGKVLWIRLVPETLSEIKRRDDEKTAKRKAEFQKRRNIVSHDKRQTIVSHEKRRNVESHIYKNKEEKEHSCSQARNGVSSTSTFGVATEPTRADRFAAKLKAILVKANKLTRSANLKVWAKQFNGLLSCAGMTASRVSAVLDWYEVHIGHKWVPRLYCARTFCDDFCRLEDAMERSIAKGEYVPIEDKSDTNTTKPKSRTVTEGGTTYVYTKIKAWEDM